MRTRLLLAAFAALVAVALLPATALATFHFVKIREVYAGSAANPDSEYIELQMYAPSQHLVNGHTVSAYSADGALEEYTFAQNVSGSANQSTILIASPEAEAQFGITADLEIDKHAMEPGGGAVCWENLDCVEWGNFSGAVLSSPTGDAAAPAPNGIALKRTITPGCATLLEAGDDTNDSAVDFVPSAPQPRPNSVTPTEKVCSVATAPETTITKHPKKKTKSKKAGFSFTSSKAASTFECSLDGALYAACSSPVAYSKLKPGKHHFEVRATAAGKTDPTGATFDWKIKKKKRK